MDPKILSSYKKLLGRNMTLKYNTFFCYFYIIKIKMTGMFHLVSCSFFGLPISWTFSALSQSVVWAATYFPYTTVCSV